MGRLGARLLFSDVFIIILLTLDALDKPSAISVLAVVVCAVAIGVSIFNGLYWSDAPSESTP